MGMNDWSVYILECADGTFYTGVCKNICERVNTHNKGKGAKYTRARLPVKCRYVEDAPDRSQACRREYAIKQLSRRQKQYLIAQGNVSDDLNH
jgi:predicted GIY-YIG superfamily endonuclease